MGIIAAAGIYALENNISRLKGDHKNAQLLAKGINNIQGLTIGAEGRYQSVMTNLVYFGVDKVDSTSRLNRHFNDLWSFEHLLKSST